MERDPRSPTTREFLIAEVRAFVNDASRLSGVTRIALIGSLTTEKPEPKDADLLVTVADDADLEPLARLGRRLQGRAQSINRGGDIFLADPEGNDLGRTCHWKRCGPGIRISCDALHCGWRHYLHDDLRSIRLPRTSSLLHRWNCGRDWSSAFHFPKTCNGNCRRSPNRSQARDPDQPKSATAQLRPQPGSCGTERLPEPRNWLAATRVCPHVCTWDLAEATCD